MMAQAKQPRISPRLALKRGRALEIISALKETYPDARCSLTYCDPLQLVVATILSAQCTDERVNLVTPALFKKYPDARSLASAPQAQLERDIQSTGFFRNKAKNIRNMAQALLDQHQGKVPQTMEALTALAGIGRKTANVVLGNAFAMNVGITVDTHVTRVSLRLGLTRQRDPVKIELDLMPVIPQPDWAVFSHLLIFHGRATCRAIKPACPRCVLLKMCPSGEKFIRSGKAAPDMKTDN